MPKNRRFQTVFPPDIAALLEALAASLSVNHSAALRIAILEACERRGIERKPANLKGKQP